MKISEMTNDRAAECLIKIAEPIGRICDDEELVGILETLQQSQGVSVVRTIGRLLPRLVVYALAHHKDDFYAIIAALEGIPEGKMHDMPLTETVRIVRDSYDDVLKNFFTQSVTASQTSETK